MPNRQAAALMQHEMRRRLERQNQVLMAALTGKHSKADAEEKVRMSETRVYIGLNDAETREQKFDTETCLGILKEVCRSYRLAFSVDVEDGGYYHEDGGYTEETSLVLVLIDADRDVVRKLTQELRIRFHQESILVTEDQIVGRFVTGEDE